MSTWNPASFGYPFVDNTDDVLAVIPNSIIAQVIVVDDKIDAHGIDTTGIHGIADTSLLETQTGAQTKATAAYNTAHTEITAATSAATTALNAHLTDSSAAHAAAAVAVAAISNLSASDVQAALAAIMSYIGTANAGVIGSTTGPTNSIQQRIELTAFPDRVYVTDTQTAPVGASAGEFWIFPS